MKEKLENFLQEINAKAELEIYREEQWFELTFPLNTKDYAKCIIECKDEIMFIRVWSSAQKTTWGIIERYENGGKMPKEASEIFVKMQKVWNFLLEEKKEIQSVLLSGDILFNFGEESTKRLEECSFIPLNYHQKQLVNGLFSDYEQVEWILALGKNEVKEMITLCVAIMEELKERKEKDKTMVSNWKLEQAIIELYYQGTEKTIHLHAKEGKLYLTFDKKEFELTTIEEISPVLSEILESIASENTTPMKHYLDYCKEASIRESVMPDIHSSLREHYSLKEIEEYAVKRLKKIKHQISMTPRYVYKNETKLFIYLDLFFVIDLENNKMTSYKEKNEAIESFKQLVLEKEKKRLDKEINELTDTLCV